MTHQVKVQPGEVGAVSDQESVDVCRRGQKADCCCYLIFGQRDGVYGFGCAKFSRHRETIDGRRLRMNAQRQGDCEMVKPAP